MRKFALTVVCSSLLFAGCTPPQPPAASTPSSRPSAPAGSGTTSQVTPAESSESQATLVALKVPTMSCPFSCWPEVKKTLEGQDGVASVELAEQKGDSVIDNPVVYVHLNGAFNPEAAVAALDKASFAGAELVKQ